MSGFKLLAIRPSGDCDPQFLKNLNKGCFYKFYQDYDFILDKKDKNVAKVIHKLSKSKNLYGENISISAVVGKNGSGKSTIIELFSLFVFCLAKHLELIDIDVFKKIHGLSFKDQNRLANELNSFNLFNCEIYFLIDNKIHGLVKNNKGFESISFKKTSSKNTKEDLFTPNPKLILSDLTSESEKNKFLSNSFFYSILANYSLYGLNTNETGIWLRSIFHKNDGYQTPIVLNPMRTEGKIDINKLTYLSKSRLLGNVFKELEEGQKEKDSLRNLINDKIVNKIVLDLDFRKFTVVDEYNLKPKQNANYIMDIGDKSIYLEFTEKNKIRNKHDYFKLLINAFFPDFDLIGASLTNGKIKRACKEYILKKAEDIVKTYPQFKEYKNKVFRSNAKEEIIKQYFKSLAGDFTHSTFKIRQAINFLFFDLYNLKNESSIIYELTAPLKESIANKINRKRESLLNRELKENKRLWEHNPNENNLEQNNKDSYRRHGLTNYLPPSFFEIDFEFKNEGYFKDLSSGEKQIIFSINSIVYHLINLDSIYTMEKKDGLAYKCFNIVFDEIELYFHPEFQRIFINELIKSINSFKGFDYKYNIIFLTHSPFILSDIPSENILMLEVENGKSTAKINNSKTFGANIHDLLMDSFFISSTTGEYAQKKIREIVDFYYKVKSDSNDKKVLLQEYMEKQDEFHYILEIIGEDVIKGILENHIQYIEDNLIGNNNKSRIERLEEEIILKRLEIKRLAQDD